MTSLVIDIETTIHSLNKRKASPWHPDNWTVAFGWKLGKGQTQGAYYGNDRAGMHGVLATLLTPEVKVVVGFNVKFDMLHLLQCPVNLAAWMKWVADGGQLFDCQLAEYLLRGQTQESQMLSLDEVAPTYGGSVKISEVKAYWERGVNTPDIPRQLLMDYLTGRGDDLGDIDNTDLVFRGQVARLQKAGMFRVAMVNMQSLIASIEMERNGVFVDVPLARKQQAALEQRKADLTARLQEFLPADLPFEFSWSSSQQKSAVIFGGKVKYEKRVPVLDEAGNQAYAQKEETHYLMADGSTMECLWWDHCNATEWAAHRPDSRDRVEYSGGLRAGEPKTKKVKVRDLDKPKSRMEDFHYVFKGYVPGQRRWLGDSGFYSTSADVIEELVLTTDVPFLKVMGELGSVTKELGSYYQVDELDAQGNVKRSKGLLPLVGPDGIVHHKINHTSTVTTRLSSSDPNL